MDLPFHRGSKILTGELIGLASPLPSIQAAVCDCICPPVLTRRRYEKATSNIFISTLITVLQAEQARVVPVECHRTSGSVSIAPVPDLVAYFGGHELQSLILTIGPMGEPLRFPLHIWYAPTLLERGEPINRAILNIDSCSDRATRPWTGPVIVLKFDGGSRRSYKDAGMLDIQTLSAYFSSR